MLQNSGASACVHCDCLPPTIQAIMSVKLNPQAEELRGYIAAWLDETKRDAQGHYQLDRECQLWLARLRLAMGLEKHWWWTLKRISTSILLYNKFNQMYLVPLSGDLNTEAASPLVELGWSRQITDGPRLLPTVDIIFFTKHEAEEELRYSERLKS